jgi:ribosome-binding protein aMBF1 (putative translation factor)
MVHQTYRLTHELVGARFVRSCPFSARHDIVRHTMQSIQVQFGRSVREWRKKRKLSQEALSAEAGLHPTYIGRLERGEQNVTIRTVQRLAHALKVRPQDLFRGLR